jgi:hypothetical protein
LREAAAAGPLLWINPTAGGGAAWALGLKAWLGICRFELAGALVVRQRGCACPALRYVRPHGRTNPIGRMVVRLELAVRRLQGQCSIGRLGLVTLNTLVIYRSLRRLGISIPTVKCRQVRVPDTSVTPTTGRLWSTRERVVGCQGCRLQRRGMRFIAWAGNAGNQELRCVAIAVSSVDSVACSGPPPQEGRKPSGCRGRRIYDAPGEIPRC